LKILELTLEFEPFVMAGLGSFVSKLIPAIANQTNELSFDVFAYGDDHIPKYSSGKNVQVYRVQQKNILVNDVYWDIIGYNISLLETVVKHYNKNAESFDLIHFHDWFVAPAAFALKNIYEKPLVGNIHQTVYGQALGVLSERRIPIHKIQAEIIVRSDHVICNSNFMKKEIERVFVAETNKISIIPNAINLDNSTDKKKEGAPPLLLFVGRLEEVKGLDHLLSLALILKNKGLNFLLKIVGKGSREVQLREKCKSLNLDHHVLFIGEKKKEALLLEYASADILLFPSIYEPFGMVLLEAMSFSLPVVSFNLGAAGEIIEDGKSGFLIAPFDIQVFAEKVELLLNNGNLRIELGNNAYERLKNYYTMDKIIPHYVKIFTKLGQVK